MRVPSGSGRADWTPEEVVVTKPSEVLFPGADEQFKEEELRSLGGLPMPVSFAHDLDDEDEEDLDFMYDDDDDDMDEDLDEDIDEDLDEEFDEDLDEDEEDDFGFEDEDEDL